MLFIRLEKNIKGSLYDRSSRLMGIAFLIVPISCFIYSVHNQLDVKDQIASTINLIAYYSTFTLMTTALFILLGGNVSKRIMAVAVAMILIYSTQCILIFTFGNDELVSTGLSASYSFFAILVVAQSALLCYKCHKLVKSHKELSEELKINVNWFRKSVALLCGLSVVAALAPIFCNFERWFRFIFMAYGALGYIHIYYGYRRILFKLTAYHITKDLNDLKEHTIEQTPEYIATIQRKVDNWVDKRRYLRKGITIDKLAKEINTNRTYLSKYINSQYNCSFRVWITTLKIDEAKLLLLECPDLTINDISLMIGATSNESFIHTFTRYEDASPSKWRETQLAKKTELQPQQQS